MSTTLPADVQSALTALLSSLLSVNNETRAEGERGLNEWIAAGPAKQELLLTGLAQESISGESDTLRSFSAILFRRISSRSPENTTDVTGRIVDHISPQVFQHLRTLFLQGFVSHQSKDVRHKMSDAIAELARPTPNFPSWSELLSTLFQGSKNEDSSIRESCYRILSAVPEIVGRDHIQAISPVFLSGFTDTSLDVRIAAVTAFSSFFQVLPKSTWSSLHPLLPHLLAVLAPLHDESKSDELSTVLESLIELAGLAPKMFKPVLKDITEFCISICKDRNMEMNARLSALELLTTFADEAPNMCKKEASYVNSMVLQCLEMMTEVGEDDEDASEWNNEDDLAASDDAEEVYSAAKQSIDRLALKLGGKVMLPPLFQWIPGMMSSADWRQRHAALMALSNVAEGCRDVMIGELDKVLDMVIPGLNDPHPRVQWATCNALGQMSTDFADSIQKSFGPRILPALISKLGNDSVPRVQAHAAAAVVNFSECADNEVLEPYLDSLLSSLLVLLQNPKKRYVQEQVLTTIAIVADAAETKFTKYFDTLMPLLFEIMKAEAGPEYRLLKAKAIECSTLISIAVGKEKFAPYCNDLVQLFVALQNQIGDSDDDPCQPYLVHAWGRICRVIGKDFLPYLGWVMPPLLAAARAQPDLQLIEEETEADSYEQQDGWELIPYNGKYIAIHTSVLDDKASAVELISVYAAELKEDFYPYVSDIVKNIVLPGINFFYHDGVRVAAYRAVPHLLSCAQEAVKKQSLGNSTGSGDIASTSLDIRQDPVVLEIWVPILAKLLDVMALEPTVELLIGLYDSFYQSVELMGRGCLNPESMDKFSKAVNTGLTDYMKRESSRQNGDDVYTEDIDEDDAEALDEDLTSEINKAIHSVFKTLQAAFLPYFETQILPIVSGFLNSPNADHRQWALCVVDDLIEFTGPESWKYKDIFLSKLVDSLVDGDAAVRQAAAYGIGVAAQHGGDFYAQPSIATLETLFNITNVPDARSDDNVHATENASAAIAKILRKHGALLGPNIDNALVEWVKTLPIVYDDDAAPFAYLFLADLIEQQHPAVSSQIPKVFESVSLALGSNSIQSKTAERVIAVTKTLLSQLPHEKTLELLQGLSAETQQAVQKSFG